MLRVLLLTCLVAFAAAKSLEVDQEPLTKDAEVVQKSEPVEAVEVSANEGRDFEFFPFRTNFRIPEFRPTTFSLFRRPISADFFSNPSERVEDTSEDSTGDAEFIPAGGSSSVMGVPNRRPAVLFPSLGEIFGDFNRRMQVFEDEIANLFRSFVRGPDRTGVREPVEPEEDTTTDQQRPVFPGFGLFRPFRPTFGGNGGGFFGFRTPSEFPDDYKNTTSTTKVINGTKVIVNETISKGGDENSSHFVHFKVIHMVPEDEETTDTAVVEEETPDQTKESTEVSPPATKSTTAGSEAVDLSHILPENGATEAETTEKSTEKSGNPSGNYDINPADFGYKDGDNEVDPHDVEVVNLPAASDKNEHVLPSGVKA